MGKIYNSSGIEVKRAIMGICPTCGLGRCGGFTHCLRCGQPLMQEESYVEYYKDLDEEIATLDALSPEEKDRLGIDKDTISLKARREQILKGIGVAEYDVKALKEGKLIRIFSNGKPDLYKEDTSGEEYGVE